MNPITATGKFHPRRLAEARPQSRFLASDGPNLLEDLLRRLTTWAERSQPRLATF